MGRLSITVIAIFAGTAPAAADTSECAAPSTCRPECDKGNVSACTWLGEYYTRPPEMIDAPAYMALGVKLLEGACTKKSGEACHELARALELAASESGKDDKRVTGLRETACKLGAGESCLDPKERLAAYEKACTAGVPRACRIAASSYGPDPTPRKASRDDPPPPPEDDSGGTGTAMALGGKPSKPAVKADPKKAKTLRDRADKLVKDACAANKARSCADNEETEPELETSCTSGAADACHSLTRKGLSTMTSTKWLDHATRACELGDFIDCQMIASSYERGENKLKKDPAQATAFYTKACDAHDGNSCSVLGKASKDPAKQLELFTRACTESEVYGCEQAADALLKTDAKKGIELYVKACELQNKMGAMYRPICGELAARYDKGDGVAKDAAKAKALRKQGCERGEKKSC